jgi:hypothetical protein
MPLRRSAVLPLLLAASLLVPSVAFCAISDADKATARELTVQGYDALKAKDYVTAADRYTRAEKLFVAAGESVPPTISLGVARAHAALGKLVSAQEHYSKITHEVVPPNASPQFLEAVQDAQRELPTVAPRVPGVIINVTGTDTAKVTIDDVEVSSAALGVRRPADPGKHVVKALAVGFSPGEATVTLTEGKTETVTIELKPGPGGPPAPTPAGPAVGPGGTPAAGAPPSATPAAPVDSSAPLRRTIGFVGIGVGGAGLIMGAVTGALALGDHSDLAKTCPGGHCPVGSQSTNQPKIDSYNLMGNLSTAGFVVGGVLAVTGIILVATAPSKPAASTQGRMILPVVSPDFTGIVGKF